MSPFIFLLMQCALLAYAILGGVFLAFSDFIMRSLSITGGVEVMQIINREVFRWVFMTLFLGMAVVSVIIVGYAIAAVGGPGRVQIMLAGVIYLVGCFGTTVFINVPMNEALAGMETVNDAAHEYWTDTYLPRWTFWNSVRTVACITSAGLLLAGLFRMLPTQLT